MATFEEIAEKIINDPEGFERSENPAESSSDLYQPSDATESTSDAEEFAEAVAEHFAGYSSELSDFSKTSDDSETSDSDDGKPFKYCGGWAYCSVCGCTSDCCHCAN